MSATEQSTAGEAAEQDGRGSSRVVIRGVQAIVLDDLSPQMRAAVLEAVGTTEPAELWQPVSMQKGQAYEAVRNYAGQSGAADAKHGKYKALPSGSWFVSAMVIEPPLP